MSEATHIKINVSPFSKTIFPFKLEMIMILLIEFAKENMLDLVFIGEFLLTLTSVCCDHLDSRPLLI